MTHPAGPPSLPARSVAGCPAHLAGRLAAVLLGLGGALALGG